MVYIRPRNSNEAPEPSELSENGELVVLPFSLSCVHEISTLKISNLPSELGDENSKSLILRTLIGLAGGNNKIPVITINSNNP